jgi:hypothetical protein
VGRRRSGIGRQRPVSVFDLDETLQHGLIDAVDTWLATAPAPHARGGRFDAAGPPVAAEANAFVVRLVVQVILHRHLV